MTPQIEAEMAFNRLKRRSPEERTLDQILAEARAEGRQAFVLDDEGVFVVTDRGASCFQH